MSRWLPSILKRIRRLAAAGKVRFTLKALRVRTDCVVVSFHEQVDDEEA